MTREEMTAAIQEWAERACSMAGRAESAESALAAERAKVRDLRAQLERFASVNVLALMDALGLTGEEPR